MTDAQQHTTSFFPDLHHKQPPTHRPCARTQGVNSSVLQEPTPSRLTYKNTSRNTHTNTDPQTSCTFGCGRCESISSFMCDSEDRAAAMSSHVAKTRQRSAVSTLRSASMTVLHWNPLASAQTLTGSTLSDRILLAMYMLAVNNMQTEVCLSL